VDSCLEGVRGRLARSAAGLATCGPAGSSSLHYVGGITSSLAHSYTSQEAHAPLASIYATIAGLLPKDWGGLKRMSTANLQYNAGISG